MVSQDEMIAIIENIEGNKDNLRRLLEQIKTGVSVIPFVGAGLTMPFGFPGWTEFLLGLARTAGIEAKIRKRISADEYEEAAEDLLAALRKRVFDDAIDSAFGNHKLDDVKLAGAVSHLPRLASGPVITTNFDHVLEKVFDNAGRKFEHVVWGSKAGMVIKAFHEDRGFLLKIHGDVEDGTDRVLTLSDYEKHYGDTDPTKIDSTRDLPKLLRLMLESRPLLFIGCSLNQDRTLDVLENVVRGLPDIAHYAIVPKPAKEAEYLSRVKFLSRHGIRPIWYPEGGHELIEPLLAYLVKARGDRIEPSKPQRWKNRLLSGPGDPLLGHRSGFFGRVDALQKVIEFLNSDETLGAITASAEIYAIKGAPGIGKTELCKEALKLYMTEHPEQRVYYVELAEAGDEAGFLTRLAEAFEMGQALGRDDVLAAVSKNPGIIYLDNLEDVLADESAIELLTGLAEVPGARVMASSRETLPGIARNISIERLDPKSAIDLFAQEWERSGTTATLSDAPELREFVEKDLDRHPLSIVLVAAQAYLYNSLKGLRDSWKQRSIKLAKLPRGPEDRLTSLDVSLSGSLEVVLKELPEAVKLWGLLGLFPEGMSQSAWNAIFGEQLAQAQEQRAILIRLNIVEQEDNGALQMLAPLRQFILAKADKKEAGLSKSVLAETAYPYFLGVAREADEHHFDDAHIATFNALLAEFPNIHHFILFAGPLGDDWPKKLSQLSFHLLNYYQFRILLGRETLEYLLGLQREADLTARIAESSHYLGYLERRLGNLDKARKLFEQAVELYKAEQSNLGLANTIQSLGDLEGRLGNLEEARKLYEQAVELYKAEQSNLGLANTIRSLGDLERRLGNVDKARKLYKQAVELYKAEQDNLGLANTIRSLGDMEKEAGRLPEARALYIEARDLYVAERDPMGLAYTLSELARVAHAHGEEDERDRLLKEALEAANASNAPPVVEYVEDVARDISPEL